MKAIYKNSNKIGVYIPEIEDLTLGIHEVFIEISLNNQSFSHSKKSIRYMGIYDRNLFIAFDKTMTPE